MDIINGKTNNEETKSTEELQNELKDARIKELEEALAKTQADLREWPTIVDLRVEQAVEAKLAEERQQREAEAQALAAAEAIDRRPRVVRRPESWEEYQALSSRDKAAALEMWGLQHIEKLSSEHFTRKRREREFNGGKK